MSYKHIFLERARNELLDAWIWYEERQEGLGDGLRMKFTNVFMKLNNILNVTLNEKNLIGKTMIKTFPYLIIYRIDKKDTLIIISSIFHGKKKS
jgi:hypothetical protein